MGHVWAGMVVVCLCLAPTRAAAEEISHVRGTGVRSNRLIESALEHSPTVAYLVNRLQASDVFVYVTVGLIDLDTAKTVLLGTPGNYRYLRVSINVTQSLGQQIVLLGHELQHALEIAEAPDVRDGNTMAALFKRIGWRSGRPNQYETHLAQAVGARVRRDVLSRLGAY